MARAIVEKKRDRGPPADTSSLLNARLRPSGNFDRVERMDRASSTHSSGILADHQHLPDSVFSFEHQSFLIINSITHPLLEIFKQSRKLF